MKTSRKIVWLACILSALAFLIWLFMPMSFDENPKAYVLYDVNGELLDAAIAEDGQWRLPLADTVELPEKYLQCLLYFEDKRFYKHRGVDWISMGRAALQNINAKSVVSGGSTISMQVIRLTRQAEKRSLWQKAIEIYLAQKLEVQKSKTEILNLYAQHAPYGGNVVGIQAASHRYFGRSIENLTWAESALLAVLPNAPSSIHLNKNRIMLFEKRNRLLKRMHEEGILTAQEYFLAIEEEIPEELRGFPHETTHLLMRLKNQYPEQHIFHTNLLADIQNNAKAITERHARELQKNGIHNAACIIADTRTGAVKAYVGNTGLFSDYGQDAFVDVAAAKRSTGSILKPFLYAHMLSKGELLPHTLLADYPTRYGNFSPQNFSMDYDGAVPASQALIRSLNVPSVNMLQKHGVPVFLNDLQSIGIHSIDKPASHYGLSLILGGAEASLDELCAAYAAMGRRLLHYTEHNARYFDSDIHPLIYLKTDSVYPLLPKSESRLTASGIWFTLEALKSLKRPTQQGEWEFFSSSQAIAWKTGTSYGFRDAWAIGVTPEFTVAVWIGNADGEGRPGLIGIEAAAPLLFDLFEHLPAYDKWFDCPWDDMIQMPVCSKSGYLSNNFCEDVDSTYIPSTAYYFPQCPYHQLVHLDETGEYRVNRSCYEKTDMQEASAFVLPPAMEWFYRQKNPWYQGVPPYHPNCVPSAEKPMQIIYPDDQMRIFVPTDLDGKQKQIVFEAVHQNSEVTIHWHIDDQYLASTVSHHQVAVQPDIGKHVLNLVDDNGNQISRRFEIINQRD
jgi:penicillin-binding protein 1C